MIRKYLAEVVIEKEADGTFTAVCPAQDDCRAKGSSSKEAFDNIVKIIELCLAADKGKNI